VERLILYSFLMLVRMFWQDYWIFHWIQTHREHRLMSAWDHKNTSTRIYFIQRRFCTATCSAKFYWNSMDEKSCGSNSKLGTQAIPIWEQHKVGIDNKFLQKYTRRFNVRRWFDVRCTV
jgi:hypothetical protein